MAIDYAVEMGYDETIAMGERLTEQVKLDERQKQKLQSILGKISPSLSQSK